MRAPHNIDESWGLYAGGADKNCGLLARVMAMSKQFGGMRDAADGKCESMVHSAILRNYNKAYKAARSGDLATFKSGRDGIAANALIPFIQARRRGTLKAASDVSKKVALRQSAATPLAQGYGIWSTIEATMAAVAPDAAEVVGTAFLLDGTPAADTYAKARRTGGVGAGPGRVKAALKSAYAKLGVKPALVGRLGAKKYLTCDGTKQALDACKAKCPKKSTFVCGANGSTYNTRCHARCYGAAVRKMGKC
ncbi:protease [Micractinium conductrix]|uniref:Protease n=1 Tax=Micractinium conductrix TaxID=554055 RepID=A0A2P6VDI4_9CHLO|nr:protease [Micractinium conductrix]|eukprot:PSC72132.1 protease [Micractinium conductrix]